MGKFDKYAHFLKREDFIMKTQISAKRFMAILLAFSMLISVVPAFALAAESDTVCGDEQTILLAAESDSGRESDFNDNWKFYLGTSGSAQNPGFDDSAWTSVTLPHDFSIIQSFTTSGEAESGFLPGGTGWYRKAFTLPESCDGKSVFISFDGVYSDAYVYVNGTLVGENHYGYISFAFDISDYITCDGKTENVIAVKAVNNIPSSRWYSGSGIYRDVTLIVTDSLHVDLNGTFVTTPDIENGIGTVDIQASIVNDSAASATVTVTNTVYKQNSDVALASAGSTVTVSAGSTVTASSAPVVDNPALWSVDSPELYTVVTELSVNGSVVDTYETDFGFRWFSFDATGFHLNGKNIKLNGVCMHHDQGALGSAAYYDAIYRQLSIMKDMGCNAIRTSHNPADEDFIKICNELGLLVIEEAFDGWKNQKNGNSNDFSRYFNTSISSSNGIHGGSSSMTWAEFAMKSMIKRDRNAPCIIAWSIGNEILEGCSSSYDADYPSIAQNLITWMKEVDTTRPATVGDNNVKNNLSTYIAVCNVIANNGGVVGLNYCSSSQNSSIRSSYSNWILYSAETASATNSRGVYTSQSNNSAADSNYHITSYDTSAVGWGMSAHDSIYNTYTKDYLAGEFVWTGFDYIGEPTPWNGTGTGTISGSGAKPNSSYFGIVDTAGFEKDTYYLYRSQWNREDTTLHLVTAWDSDNMMTSSSKTPVWVYSNAPVVKLYRNDTLIGTATRVTNTTSAGYTYYTYTTTSNSSSICTTSSGSGADGLYAVFNVAYTSGTLSAKAFESDGTTEIKLSANSGQNTVTTPGTVSKLEITQNKTEIDADGSSLAYIEVEVQDANGNLDTTATNSITFTLSGNGRIMGVDNGDQATTAKYQQSSVLTSSTSAHINAYAGKALVIVRSTDEAGSITVNSTSSGLTGGSVTINTKEVESDTVTDGLVSYSMVRDYSVIAGTQPVLKTTATGTLAGGSTVSGSIVWEDISESTYSTAGDYTVNGTLTFDGEAPIAVSARLHVIANVIALRNISAATSENTVPSLPGTVSGILADGTVSGEFTVEWDEMTGEQFAVVGDIVTINGSAVIIGNTTLPVTASVRVAETFNSESSNVAPMASLTQDIAVSNQSDNLSSIVNGTLKPGDNTSERWTNWNNRTTSDQAALTFTWATAQMLESVDLYYYYDNCCAYPASIEFSYSLNGVDYTSVDATAALIESYTLGAQYTYTFAAPINPVGLKITFTQQNGTSGSNCVGLTEAEINTFAGSIEYNSSALLSSISVDGTALSGFAPETYSYEADGEAVAAATDVNAGITVLPVLEDVVRILTISEDGSSTCTYEITLSANTCIHEHKELSNASEADCTTNGYTGDIYCTDCGKLLSSGTVIEATGHTTEIKNAKAASCTETGYTGDTYCTICNETIAYGEAIAPTGHTTKLVNVIPATCTSTGYSGDTICTICGETVSTGTITPANGHSWNSGVITKPATSTEEGVITYTCTECGETYTETIPVIVALNKPILSISASAATGNKIKFTGTIENIEYVEENYELLEYGIVYIMSSRLGTRTLTVSTAGRTKVRFSAYNSEGSFSYTMRPSSSYVAYSARAYLIYRDENGNTIYTYSDVIKTSYYGLR